ncbi:MAG: helix-turn-helix domain-containing protein [Rhodanobacteraceae bacterium]
MIDHEDRPDLFAAPTPCDDPSTVGPAAEAHADAPNEQASVADPGTEAEASNDSLGKRLRTAREMQGFNVAECAGKLHLPIKVLERLEADDFGEPEHFVYLRGALCGYARLLGLPSNTCDGALRAMAPAEQPALVSVARTSPARWLLQRYGTAATYIVLTATIAVPLVLLGLRGGLERPSTRIVSLDQASALVAPHKQTQSEPTVSQPGKTAAPDTTPFRASMTPFAAIGLRDVNPPVARTSAPVAPVSIPTAVPSPVGQHTLTVTASADCWFEITGADGNKIDSGMLHAGDVRTWHANGTLHVTLGNAGGVTASEDGKPVDLAAFRHANVARLDLFSPAAGGSEND